ncbi:unnamed protein product, partial [Symbiodinium microadriaticum]
CISFESRNTSSFGLASTVASAVALRSRKRPGLLRIKGRILLVLAAWAASSELKLHSRDLRIKNKELRAQLSRSRWPELLAYSAAFFDGDGCVGCKTDSSGCMLRVASAKRKKNAWPERQRKQRAKRKKNDCQERQRKQRTKRKKNAWPEQAEVLLLSREAFGGSIMSVCDGVGLRKRKLQWQGYGQSARRAAELLAPHGTTKQKQLWLAAQCTTRRLLVHPNWEYCSGFFDAEGYIGQPAQLALNCSRENAAQVNLELVATNSSGRGATSTAATSDTIAAATYPSTWSNPSGSVLTALNTDLWVAERPFIWNSIDVGGKMAVVRLPDGGLWVHSPVELDEELRDALDQLGPVRHIVSPNFEHVKWAAQWKEAFPDATLWGTPGMKEKFPKIPFDLELPSSGSAPAEWGGALLLCFADCERTPLLGTPFFNEVIFYHVASETLMCTDIFWNYPSDLPSGSALWKFLMDKVYLPFYKRFMVKSPGSLKAVLDAVAAWKPKGLLPCHGKYVANGAWQLFEGHLTGSS